MAADLNERAARALIGALVAGGVRHAVLSPGSRNTPVVLAVHALAQEGRLTVHSVLDERAAGFLALGLSRVTGAPALLSCTSGSAGAHYLPALIEANQSRVPLIALTADRPAELQGCGAPQTIDQRTLYQGQLRWSADLSEPGPVDPRWLGGVAARALDAACGHTPGPVHLNLPFREPLWIEASAEPAVPAAAPAIIRGPPTLAPHTVDALARRLAETPRGVFVAGPLELALERVPWGQYGLCDPLYALAERLGWPVLAEPTSNLRFGRPHPLRICAADALCRAGAPLPRLAVRFGQLPTSKPVFQWLAKVEGGVAVDPSGRWHDPDHRIDTVLAAEPAALCEALLARLPDHQPLDPGWGARWQTLEARAQAVIDDACGGPLWEGAVARQLSRALPPGALLHVASSMPVRDLDGFGISEAEGAIVTANRGANGIDGTLATAIGQARAHDGPTVVLLGDLAFLHDQGALGLARGLDTPFVVVVVDNGGGGIFEHLPIARHPTAFVPHFITPHDDDLCAIAAAARWSVVRCADAPGLAGALQGALRQAGPTLLYVPIDRAQNLARHRQTWAAVRAAVADVL
ncbi:MAG: 2-succinyl-5-enolpyruvyl-6-hydroxy-3-cyclohexene-1-carboxylic-acid synthase [Alphaproteobacteria bacterium]|nr:2-succinyl-5-enolpyruvyl-6-hydroxy-3-cyclohexene-1-carboxylic-acid synthase [Alphaproteobacteria bacterium]